MGIFTNGSIYNRFKSLQEVEKTTDGTTEDLSANDTGSTTTDYTKDADDSLNLPDEEDESAENEEQQEEPSDDNDQREEPDEEKGEEEGEEEDDGTTDYTKDADNAINSFGDDSFGSDSSKDQSSNSAPQQEEQPGNKSDLQNLEMELFSDLTPEQINIKHYELKRQYIELYNKSEDIVDRINTIPKTEQNLPIIDFVVKKLVNLREYINYYLTKVYQTKTYIENTTNYQQYLAVLNAINKILSEIPLEND